MAKCLRCHKGGKSRRARNWQDWQLCYPCAKILHPKEYANEHPHGTGGRGAEPATYNDFIVNNILSEECKGKITLLDKQ